TIMSMLFFLLDFLSTPRPLLRHTLFPYTTLFRSRKQLTRVPFIPFLVRTSDGHEYSVPTVDHAYITPRGNRVIVTDDKGTVAILGPLHINSVIEQPNDA